MMEKRKFSFTYAVIDQGGNQSGQYPLRCPYSNSLCAVTCAAEDYDAKPESDGAVWPLTFVVYHMNGDEYCRYQVKRWHVPHFLVIRGGGSDIGKFRA